MPTTESPPSKHEMLFKGQAALYNAGSVKTDRVFGMCITVGINRTNTNHHALYIYIITPLNRQIDN